MSHRDKHSFIHSFSLLPRTFKTLSLLLIVKRQITIMLVSILLQLLYTATLSYEASPVTRSVMLHAMHPTQVNAPRPNSSQPCGEGWKAELTWMVDYTLCSEKLVHQAHIDNLVNSQRIFIIPSLAHSLENLR